jgi:predicted dehydrogenase
MTRVRVAVVGLGAIAFEHLAKLAQRADAEVVGVCDVSPTLAAAVAERFGVGPAYSSYARMLADARPDVVHVLTPPQSHRDLVVAALEAGAHVLVEKPIATTLEEYGEMHAAARAAGRMLCENYNYRFSRGVLAALDAHARGDLGEIVGVDVSFGGVMGADGPYGDLHVPHFAHALPGGAMQNFVSHPVSLALPFIGGCERAVAFASRSDPGFPSDDELRAVLEGPRASAVVTVSRNAWPAHFLLAVQGTRARVAVDVYGASARVDATASVIGGGLRRGLHELRVTAATTLRAFTGRRDAFEGLGALMDAFYDAAIAGGPSPVSHSEMLAVNAVVRDLLVPVESPCT